MHADHRSSGDNHADIFTAAWGTTYAFVDYSNAGPTTWGACRLVGVSTGLHYNF